MKYLSLTIQTLAQPRRVPPAGVAGESDEVGALRAELQRRKDEIESLREDLEDEKEVRNEIADKVFSTDHTHTARSITFFA